MSTATKYVAATVGLAAVLALIIVVNLAFTTGA